MRQTLYILIFFCFLVNSQGYGQMTSIKVDSLTKSIFKARINTAKEKYAFLSIINERKNNNLFSHVDTTAGDYIFISEYFFSRDSSATSKEEYFNDGDSIPIVIYMSDSIYEVGYLYTSTLKRESLRIINEEYFTPKSKRFKSYNIYQELAYNKTQTRFHGCVDNDRTGRKFKEITEERLKGTFAIYTLIDNRTHKFWISFQYPPKKPKFKIDTYNPVWDF